MTVASSLPRSAVRDWWLRTLVVLQHPRPVFVSLRDDSKETAGDMAEPILLVVILAGIAGVLTTGTAAHLNDGGDFDPGLIAIWAFFFGTIYGAFVYFAVGGFLHLAVKWLGSLGTYRRTRHVLAFASVPMALSLVLWPVKLALYGGAWFRTGGGDTHAGGAVFDLLTYVFFAWSLALLVTGIRSVHGWSWRRAAAATGLALVVPVLVGLASTSV